MAKRLTKAGLENAAKRRSSGPSRREIDLDKVYELASIGMSCQKICDFFGVALSTYESNQDWVDVYKEGNASYFQLILKNQIEVATDKTHRGQTSMLIHLGKTMLGQSEKIQNEIKIDNQQTSGFTISLLQNNNNE